MNKQAEHENGFRDSAQHVETSRIFGNRWKRSVAFAHAKTQSEHYRQADFVGKPVFSRAADYLKIRVFQWAWHYLRSRFGGKWEFPDYTPFEADNGIYDLAAPPEERETAAPVRVSLVSDWGCGTKEAFDVGECIRRESPEFTIHLGDVYYVGEKTEIQKNMLGGLVQWPIGSRGSFALNANHEMYSRGKGYFKYLLPALGIYDDAGCPHEQKASFFCLRNEYWLVIGLDTGYYSVGIPILEMIMKPSAKLHPKLLDWLQSEVRLQEDKQRGVILLSHHQYYSQFESGYDRSARQLAQLLDRPVLWFWGHEHRLAIYGKHATKKAGLEAYGRCIGHGGLPIEDIGGRPKRDQKHRVGLVLYDRRERTKVGSSQVPVGYNGYANLVFEERNLTVEYKDTLQLLVKENWVVGDGGVLKGISIERLVEDNDLVLHEGASRNDAIK